MGLWGEVLRSASGDDILLPREMGDGVGRPVGRSKNSEKKEDDGLADTSTRFREFAEGALSQRLLSTTVRASAMPASCRP
jgi:hypothetical protein